MKLLLRILPVSLVQNLPQFFIFYFLFFCVCFLTSARCLKITQNVAFEFWPFSSIFVLLKLTCLVTLFDRKLQVFKNSPKWTFCFAFLISFCPLKMSLCSQCWMRLRLWFSNTMPVQSAINNKEWVVPGLFLQFIQNSYSAVFFFSLLDH